MNREQTKEAIKVMQAYVDGEDIEFFGGLSWKPCESPAWQWTDIRYRIRPKPREFWVHPKRNVSAPSGNEFNCVDYRPVNSEYIKVREVIE